MMAGEGVWRWVTPPLRWALLALAGIATIASTGAAAAADWRPDRAIEFIVPTGPGSGVDNTARTLQSIFQARKLVEQPITVSNRAGGGYGVALAYLAQNSGDGHRLLIQTSTPLAALLTGQLKADYFGFTPVANLISEPIAFMVRADSPLRTARDLAERLRTSPDSVSIALAAARGNAYHIAAALVARAVKGDVRQLKIVVFGSSGEAMTALLGGHVDVLSVTPGNFLPHVEAKRARLLGVASRERHGGGLAQVATLREQGLDVVFDVPRGFIGPRGLTPEQLRYWDGVFQRMLKSPEWREALEKNQWVEDYRASADMGRDLKAQYEILRDVLAELGMVK